MQFSNTNVRTSEKQRRRIVITGMGAVTPIGNSVDEYWRSLLDGVCGVAPITLFDPAEYPTKIAAEVKNFDGRDYFDRKDLRMMARPTQFGVAAALMALRDAGWNENPGDGPLGVVNGISNSAQDAVEKQIDNLIQHGYRRVIPHVLTQSFPHSTASETGRITGFQDHVMTISTGCTSGMNSIGYAINEIRAGKCSSMLAISTDATIAKYVFAGFCRAQLLTEKNSQPEQASKPFDLNRDGGVLGEGAGAFVIEELHHARAKNRRILAEIIGYAGAGSGYSFDDEIALGKGMDRAILEALADANLAAAKIDYVGCHGVSDKHLDRIETQAYKRVFGEHAYKIPMSSVKGHIGIPQNAAGHLQALATVKAMNEGILPPTLNYENPDPDCDLDYIPNQPRRNRIRTALVFAHGFNGSDAALVLKAAPFDLA